MKSPLGLSILTVVMLVESLSMTEIVASQSNGVFSWLIFRTPFTFIAFFIFFISAIAEVNRTPFDLPEAESEIVAGFHTEYSGMRFALFFIAEYANMFAVSAIAVTLFLGGWEGVLPGFDILGGMPGFVIKNIRTCLPYDVAEMDAATSAGRSTHEPLLEVLHSDRLLQHLRHRHLGTHLPGGYFG